MEQQKKGLVAAVGQTSAPAFRCYHCQRDGHYANRCPDRNLERNFRKPSSSFQQQQTPKPLPRDRAKNNPGAEKQGADLEAG